jgi:adenosylcobinamide-phosphate synthase
MSNVLIAFFAIVIDRFFGNLHFPKHPLIIIGELISFFEEDYFKDSVLRGFWLVSFVITVVSIFAFAISFYLAQFNIIVDIFFSSIIASFFIAHKTLYETLKVNLTCNETKTYKNSIEKYAEKLSIDLIAPLLYLLLFGLPGMILYKTIVIMNTMLEDDKYKKYGAVTFTLNSFINYIPSRLSALIIMIIARQKEFFPLITNPITAMEMAIHVKDKKVLFENDLKAALSFRNKIEITLLLFLGVVFFIFR